MNVLVDEVYRISGRVEGTPGEAEDGRCRCRTGRASRSTGGCCARAAVWSRTRESTTGASCARGTSRTPTKRTKSAWTRWSRAPPRTPTGSCASTRAEGSTSARTSRRRKDTNNRTTSVRLWWWRWLTRPARAATRRQAARVGSSPRLLIH